MSWQVIIPIKSQAARKTRLADTISEQKRAGLTEEMLAHILAVVQGHPAIGHIYILSAQNPFYAHTHWLEDHGRGLNEELDAARAHLGAGDHIILHADLPCLSHADIDALIAAAQEKGVAVAADRHGQGTNAVAICAGQAFAADFGVESLHRHLAQLGPRGLRIDRPGLAMDIDTPDDLQLYQNSLR